LPGLYILRAVVLLNARRYQEAERQAKLAMELAPSFLAAPVILGEVYKLTGRPEEAVRVLSSPKFANSAVLAHAYAAAGRRDEALALVDSVKKNPSPTDPRSIAMVYFNLGDDEQGFHWLQRAAEKRLSSLRFLNVDPAYDKWRADPRFVALVRQLRLPATIG
jgi:predicted Zn-dependent protease